MSKIMQQEHLIVYPDDIVKGQYVDYLKSEAITWADGEWFNQLTCRGEHGQYRYTFVKLEPYDDFIMKICGCEFYTVRFLEGVYHSDIIMFALGRCRLGVWEVDEI